MDVVNLPRGDAADDATDCIKIVARPGGGFDLEGSLLITCQNPEETESIAIVDGTPYDTEDEALDAGLAWASGYNIDLLYVSRVG